MKPMLFHSVNGSELDDAIVDPNKWLQQKLNGVRVFMRVADGKVTALGRDGQPKANPIPRAILDEFAAISLGEWYFDGELVDGVLWLFDLGITGVSYDARLSALERFVTLVWEPRPCVQVVSTWRTSTEKAEAVWHLREIGAEGVMIKDTRALYRPGKRSFEIVKAKFWHDVDAIVSDVHVEGKANFTVALVDGAGGFVHVGTCKLEAGVTVRVGDIVTVRYLYVDTNRLVQAHLECVRDPEDKPWQQCTVDQLHYTDKHTIHS